MVSNTVLFCQVCKEEIAVKKSVIKGHIARKKPHSASKEKLAKEKKWEIDIAEALEKNTIQRKKRYPRLPEYIE